MEIGPAAPSFWRSDHLAGDNVLSSKGRSAKLSTSSRFAARPSATRFHAASKRSSASPAGPTRSSSAFAKLSSRRLHVAPEVVAQLLDRPEFVRSRASAQLAPVIGVLDQLAVAQAISEVVVQFDFQNSFVYENPFMED